METSINHDEWTKLDTAKLGWDEPEVWVKDIELPSLGMIVNAEVHSPDGRSPFFLMHINGDTLLCTIPQGNTLSVLYDIEGTP